MSWRGSRRVSASVIAVGADGRKGIDPRRLAVRCVLALAFTLPLLASDPCLALNTLHGRVISVSDGDTLTVLDAARRPYRIRLAGIDAPERAQPYANVSRQALVARTMHREVTVQWSKLDRYDRIVGTVLVDGIDVNLAQVADGLAWHYRQYDREQSFEDRLRYQQAEDWARKRGIGLWAGPNPVPPWKFRRE